MSNEIKQALYTTLLGEVTADSTSWLYYIALHHVLSEKLLELADRKEASKADGKHLMFTMSDIRIERIADDSLNHIERAKQAIRDRIEASGDTMTPAEIDHEAQETTPNFAKWLKEHANDWDDHIAQYINKHPSVAPYAIKLFPTSQETYDHHYSECLAEYEEIMAVIAGIADFNEAAVALIHRIVMGERFVSILMTFPFPTVCAEQRRFWQLIRSLTSTITPYDWLAYDGVGGAANLLPYCYDANTNQVINGLRWGKGLVDTLGTALGKYTPMLEQLGTGLSGMVPGMGGAPSASR